MRRKIAVDAMTLEGGIEPLVKAIRKELKKYPDLELILIGDNSIKYLEEDRVSIKYSSEIIRGNDSLRQILTKLEDSSTYIAAQLVKEEVADVGISFGNTKGVGLSVIKTLGPLNGIKKLPLSVAVPSFKRVEGSEKGEWPALVFLDVGATTSDDVNARTLLEFAILGKYYAKQIGINNPKIALLSNGEEREKGVAMTKAAYALYERYLERNESFDFVGFCEPKPAFVGGENKPDVLVCDGYSGNLILKTLEAFYALYQEALRESARVNLIHKVTLGIARSLGVFKSANKILHPDHYGGAYILGLENRPFIKGHGSSNEFAIESAIDIAYNSVPQPYKREIIEELSQIENIV